jgi:hypothetical protein
MDYDLLPGDDDTYTNTNTKHVVGPYTRRHNTSTSNIDLEEEVSILRDDLYNTNVRIDDLLYTINQLKLYIASTHKVDPVMRNEPHQSQNETKVIKNKYERSTNINEKCPILTFQTFVTNITIFGEESTFTLDKFFETSIDSALKHFITDIIDQWKNKYVDDILPMRVNQNKLEIFDEDKTIKTNHIQSKKNCWLKCKNKHAEYIVNTIFDKVMQSFVIWQNQNVIEIAAETHLQQLYHSQLKRIMPLRTVLTSTKLTKMINIIKDSVSKTI